MVDISALMRVLPVSALEPDWVATIGGLIEAPQDQAWRESIVLLEPPAGRRVPYIEPLQAVEKLLRRRNVAPDDAEIWAREAVVRLKKTVKASHWVNFFNCFEPESPECLPAPDFVAWLRGQVIASSDVVDFIERATEVATATPIFRGPDNRSALWSLENLHMSPKAMIEFVPGAPWADFHSKTDSDGFLAWRESIRPVAQALEKTLGETVYHFADSQDACDDDYMHRFLVLHWCCTHKPESAFVKYVAAASGARDAKELKAALIDPVSYVQPFKMKDAFIGLEVLARCRFDYLPPDGHKTAAVAFFTAVARNVAQELLAQKIGAHAFIIAPEALATAEWVKRATRYCRSWRVRYVRDRKLDDPIETLALIDELSVIADEKTSESDFDLKLPDSVEDLLWLARDLGVEAAYFHIDRVQLSNPEICLTQRGAPERSAARQAQRSAFTRQLTELRLDAEYWSSGLWNADGKMLGYDLLDLPFPLVKRIAAWQRDFDDTVTPPDEGDEAWRERHNQEEIEIGRALQLALGPSVAVKVFREGEWRP
jgi:hypothetical protein